jgi:hypothetical protein
MQDLTSILQKKGGEVSAFAAKPALVLGQVKVADKSNEIIAIPKLLDMLAIFASPHLPLRLWFRPINHLTQTKQGFSSIELGRRLGVTQTTAWKIKQAREHIAFEARQYVVGVPLGPGRGYPRIPVTRDRSKLLASASRVLVRSSFFSRLGSRPSRNCRLAASCRLRASARLTSG